MLNKYIYFIFSYHIAFHQIYQYILWFQTDLSGRYRGSRWSNWSVCPAVQAFILISFKWKVRFFLCHLLQTLGTRSYWHEGDPVGLLMHCSATVGVHCGHFNVVALQGTSEMQTWPNSFMERISGSSLTAVLGYLALFAAPTIQSGCLWQPVIVATVLSMTRFLVIGHSYTCVQWCWPFVDGCPHLGSPSE